MKGTAGRKEKDCPGGGSYVTMEVCAICHGETGSILMDTRLRDSFCRIYTINPGGVCCKCREQYLETGGVLLINPETGHLLVIKEDWYNHISNVPFDHRRIVFCEEEVLRILSLRYKEETGCEISEAPDRAGKNND